MKKLFTLGLTLLLTAITAGAQDEQSRKLWDFRQGFSDETLANFAADAAASDGYWTDKTANGFYESKAGRSAGEVKCKVGGEDWVVPETQGLVFAAKSAQHLCIQFKSETFGPHVWLNGKKDEDAVTIPNVPAGDSVTVIFSSHKDTDSRGFTIKTSGFTGKDGSTTTWKTKGMDTAVIINNNAEASDLKLQATSGMHYHFICIGETPKGEEQPVKIAYLYDSGYANYDPKNDPDNTLSEIISEYFSDAKYISMDVAGDMSAVTADSLKSFDAVIVSGAINASSAYASTIKEAIAFVPILNLSTNLYEAWGYGKATPTQTNTVLVGEAARKSSLFSPSISGEEGSYIDEEGNLQLLVEGESITGYTAEEGSYFANDSVYATADGVNAIHFHNAGHNAYLMIPYSYNQVPEDNAVDILYNALSTLIDSKASITNTAKPLISETYNNLSTSVSIKSGTKNAKCYYTTDGTEPTLASTPYTEPFEITDKDVTVKAIAIADGYLLSEVSEKTIAIHELAKTPTFSLEMEDGKTTVTLVPANEGDSVYFNYTGSNAIAQSELYTAPFVLTKHATISTFTAAKGNYLQSETASEDIEVLNEKVRIDIVSQFNANQKEWQSAAGTYYVGKSGYNFYTDEVIGTETDSTGTVHNIYAPADSLYTYNPGNGWEVKTYGQVIAWESNTLGHNVGDPNAYNPATAYDDSEANASNCHITFAGVGSNGDGEKDPTSAFLQSTEAFQAPFDIVAIVGGKDSIKLEVSVATDTTDVKNWQSIGYVYSPKVEADSKGRLYQKNLLSYEGTDKVFVKLAAKNTSGRLFNVIIYNAGEKSGEYTGIVNVNKKDNATSEVVRTIVYSMNGTQLNKAAKGLNIVKTIYADGTVKTQKVIVK